MLFMLRQFRPVVNGIKYVIWFVPALKETRYVTWLGCDCIILVSYDKATLSVLHYCPLQEKLVQLARDNEELKTEVQELLNSSHRDDGESRFTPTNICFASITVLMITVPADVKRWWLGKSFSPGELPEVTHRHPRRLWEQRRDGELIKHTRNMPRLNRLVWVWRFRVYSLQVHLLWSGPKAKKWHIVAIFSRFWLLFTPH